MNILIVQGDVFIHRDVSKHHTLKQHNWEAAPGQVKHPVMRASIEYLVSILSYFSQ